MTGPITVRRRRWRLVALAVSVVFLAAACGGGDDPAGEATDARTPGEASRDAAAVGDLPGDTFEMADGTTVAFADLLDGRPLVVNYFASWCAPCRAEMPDFAIVHAEVGDRVGFLGLALQDSPSAAAELVELTGVSYPWGLDPTGAMFATLGGFAMPSTFYVAADGQIVGQDNGPIDEGTLRDRLGDLFGVTS